MLVQHGDVIGRQTHHTLQLNFERRQRTEYVVAELSRPFERTQTVLSICFGCIQIPDSTG